MLQGGVERRHGGGSEGRQRVDGAVDRCRAVAGQRGAQLCGERGGIAVGRDGIRGLHAALHLRVGQPLEVGGVAAVGGSGGAVAPGPRVAGGFAPVPAPHGAPERTLAIPAGIGRVPVRSLRFLHAVEQELHHVARPLRAVGGGAVPQFVVGDDDRARGAGQRQHVHAVRAFPVVLAAGQHGGGAQALWGILGIVEQQHLAGAVIPLAAAILMDALRLAAGLVGVAVAVIVQQVARPEDAGQGAVHRRVREHLRQLRDPRQQVVAGVGFGAEQRVGLTADQGVELIRQRGMHRHVAVADEVLHLPIGKQICGLNVGGHRGSSRLHSTVQRPNGHPPEIRPSPRSRGHILVMTPQAMRPPAPPMGWVRWSSGCS